MKRIIFAVAPVALAMSAIAAEPDKVLSIQRIEVGGAEIVLPTTQKADGTVCVSYLSEDLLADDKPIAKVSQHCERMSTSAE